MKIKKIGPRKWGLDGGGIQNFSMYIRHCIGSTLIQIRDLWSGGTSFQRFCLKLSVHILCSCPQHWRIQEGGGKSLNFMQFSAKSLSNNRLVLPLGLTPPFGKFWIYPVMIPSFEFILVQTLFTNENCWRKLLEISRNAQQIQDFQDSPGALNAERERQSLNWHNICRTLQENERKIDREQWRI